MGTFPSFSVELIEFYDYKKEMAQIAASTKQFQKNSKDRISSCYLVIEEAKGNCETLTVDTNFLAEKAEDFSTAIRRTMDEGMNRMCKQNSCSARSNSK